MSLDIAILVTGEPPAELAERHAGYGSMIECLLRAQDSGISCTHYDVRENCFPAAPDAHDAYMITGSRHAAYEDLPWIHRLAALIRELDAARKPLVGICFGHQLIAQALGGRVEKASQGWGVGVHRTNITARAAWMDQAEPQLQLIVSHQDQVVELPGRAELLAGSEFCPVAMYRVESHLFAMQAHPEFSHDYSRELMQVRRPIIGEERIEAGLHSLAQPVDAARVAGWLLAFMRQAHA